MNLLMECIIEKYCALHNDKLLQKWCRWTK